MNHCWKHHIMLRVISKWPAANVSARSTSVMTRNSSEERFLPRVLSQIVYQEFGLCIFLSPLFWRFSSKSVAQKWFKNHSPTIFLGNIFLFQLALQEEV